MKHIIDNSCVQQSVLNQCSKYSSYVAGRRKIQKAVDFEKRRFLLAAAAADDSGMTEH
ncbi:hypothetical protein J6590_077660 [Homalodisca vitripennis]|nr:hypothetical protein J6590_077660 [Homalodisca vitripennis]